MSQRINHRREGARYQDNGPRWENPNPMHGCNATHVARARRAWRVRGRRSDRRRQRQITHDELMPEAPIACAGVAQ